MFGRSPLAISARPIARIFWACQQGLISQPFCLQEITSKAKESLEQAGWSLQPHAASCHVTGQSLVAHLQATAEHERERQATAALPYQFVQSVVCRFVHSPQVGLDLLTPLLFDFKHVILICLEVSLALSQFLLCQAREILNKDFTSYQ